MEIQPERSPLVFGIDLGTTNSSISVYHRGEQVILKVQGKTLFPSAVFIEKNETKIGSEARRRAVMYPDNTIVSAKRHMGTGKTWEVDGQRYSSQDIATLLLSNMADAVFTEDQEIDLEGRPYHVVITVPANFNDLQKQLTKEAAQNAGLDVIDLLEEPVAAALAYASQQGGIRNVLVYDLGGGTFDVSILEIETKNKAARINMRVLAKDGVPDIGGDDFDRALMKIAAARFNTTTGMDILDEKRDQGFSKAKQRKALQKLRDACEQAKHDLSGALSTTLLLPDLLPNEAGDPQGIEMTIERSQFESEIAALLNDTRDAVVRALDAAKKSPDDIDRVILVGGSTRVPAVRALLIEMFNKEPYGNINPDTAVAAGAGMYGAILQNPDKSTDTGFGIEQIVSHHLGVLLHEDKFSWLLTKGAEIPAEGLSCEDNYTNVFDNQSRVKFPVYQSFSPDPPEFLTGAEVNIGEFSIAITPVAANQAKITVKFELSPSNMLTVTATSDIDSGKLPVQVKRTK
jgi:molecular chaperone DnaK